MKRFYNENTSDRFSIWKDYYKKTKHRERLLLRTILHWQQIQLVSGLNSFVNYKSRDFTQERTKKIKHIVVL